MDVDEAQQAGQELPGQGDAGLLQEPGIDPMDLVGTLGGGGGLGGLLDRWRAGGPRQPCPGRPMPIA